MNQLSLNVDFLEITLPVFIKKNLSCFLSNSSFYSSTCSCKSAEKSTQELKARKL